MTQAIVVSEYGGPEVLKLQDLAAKEPGPGEILPRQTAVGLNFHDCYDRSGLYKSLSLPGIPGIEAVGVVTQVGPGVERPHAGERVGYVAPDYGGYAQSRVLPADWAIPLPDEIDDLSAASILVKGLTVCMLVRRVHAIENGETVLVHAAAGVSANCYAHGRSIWARR
jgi:NADPH2:quinone reductase